ncbi:MAG: hypothetical protein C4560_05275 [Nitrospiraceae bacterium]|nr:MAG: hypothetical protein C4560_05275 [Nitrospiraceae bacterium]
MRDGATTRYIYDAFGNLLAEADEPNNITKYFTARIMAHELGHWIGWDLPYVPCFGSSF